MDIWRERKSAIEGLLGPADDSVLTSTVPIYLGGFADVMAFSDFIPGKTYVTGGLVGLGSQRPNQLGDYELMICTREPSKWAGNLISRLARYTHDAELNPGETMSIESALPKGSSVSALVFTQPDLEFGEYFVNGDSAHLLLCIGITPAELKLSRSKGADDLLSLLKENEVSPYTDLKRKSTV
jgi:hypothetical protein